MITVLNYLALKSTATSNGSAFVRGKSTSGDGGEGTFLWDPSSSETPNEGTIIESTVNSSGHWKRVIEEKVNVQWFGAIPNCYKSSANYTIIPTVTDCTAEIQAAIDFCIAHSYDLYMPSGEINASKVYGGYLVNNTLNVTAPLNIYAEVNAIVTGFITDKTKPIFLIKDCDQGKIENLTIQGCGYLPLAGIQFSSTLGTNEDSQGMELNNVRIYNCRHGVYSEGVETINRMVFNRCVFVSNLIAGFYLKSFIGQNSTSLGSGPITFINTIINGNGIPNWMTTQRYQNVQILGSNDHYGYQIYAQGFGNLSYIGGQISAHGEPKLLALAHFDSGFGVNLTGVDVEDISKPVTLTGELIPTNGTGYDANYGVMAGAAILVNNVRGFNFTQSHLFNINTQTVFRFVDKCGDVNIQVADLEAENTNRGNFKYSIDVAQSVLGLNNVLTNLNYTGEKIKLSPSAFTALDKSCLEVLTSIKGPLVPSSQLDAIFTNKPKITVEGDTRYALGYIGTSSSPTFSAGTYISKSINLATVVYVLIECTQNSFMPHGKFFIQQSGSFGSEYTLVDLRGAENVGNTSYVYAKYILNPLATNLKYGFINSMNYTGNIPDHATVKGFTVYVDYQSPILKRRPVDMDF
jgi:hypothetical protein